MALPLSSQQQLYDIFVQKVQSKLASLTDTLDGSILDGLAGGYSLAGMELQRQTVLEFNKTFIDLANGPEVTGDADDLQTLAVDHYGEAFARPGAVAATDTQTFFRPKNSFGACDIPVDSVVQTQPDANGNVQQYETQSDVGLTFSGAQSWTVVAANVTAGAIYADANGNHYTATGTIVVGTTLATTGTTLPIASPIAPAIIGLPILAGTLTKVSGTGDATITYTALSAPDCLVTIGIEALVAGAAGSATAGAINVIESSLLDSSIVALNAGNATGVDAEDDSEYRETIRELIVSLRAAVKAAIEAAAKTVSGVISATAVEIEQAVVTWNIGLNAPQLAPIAGVYEYFYIPYVTLYIAQTSGPATPTQVAEVIAAINPIRAFGVNITVTAANTVTINWSLHPILNPAGPNFATLSGNTAALTQSMQTYIATLGTGVSFIRQTAEAAILALYGPKGTNDLVAQYLFNITAGNATVGATYTDGSGNIFTVVNTIIAGTTLMANSNGGGTTTAPVVSGTLTKTGGTGDATITFSSAQTTMTTVPSGDVAISSTQNAIPGTIATV